MNIRTPTIKTVSADVTELFPFNLFPAVTPNNVSHILDIIFSCTANEPTEEKTAMLQQKVTVVQNVFTPAVT